MKYLFTLIIFSFSLFATDAQANTLSEKIAIFSTAQADEDRLEAANLALGLVNEDYSQSPFSPAEIRDLKASLAETLAEDNRYPEAAKLLSAIITEEQSVLNGSDNPEKVSALRNALAYRFIQRAEVYDGAGQIDLAIEDFRSSHEYLTAIYGRWHENMTFLNTLISERYHQRAKASLESADYDAAYSDVRQITRYDSSHFAEAEKGNVPLLEKTIMALSKTAQGMAKAGNYDGVKKYFQQANQLEHSLPYAERDLNARIIVQTTDMLKRRAQTALNRGDTYNAYDAFMATKGYSYHTGSQDSKLIKNLIIKLIKEATIHQNAGRGEQADSDFEKATDIINYYPYGERYKEADITNAAVKFLMMRADGHMKAERFEEASTDLRDASYRYHRTYRGEPNRLTYDPDKLEAMRKKAAEIAPPLPMKDQEYAAAMMMVPEQMDDNWETIEVFYGTNRKRHKRFRNAMKATGIDKENIYTRGRDTRLEFGSALVTVPKNRKPGSVPRPGAFRQAVDGVHIVLKSANVKTKSEFTTRLSDSISQNPRKEAFVFIHGHGVSFADSARRTAQLAVDLDIRNGATFFSWPAGHVAVGYQVSQNNVEPSEAHLIEFLRLLKTESGADTIHIMAHSMGNRILLKALTGLVTELGNADNPPFDQVVWASPDVDAEVFAQKVSATVPMSKNMTLYASQKDRALSLSKFLGGKYPRAGQAPPLPVVTTALSSVIDTTSVSREVSDVIAHADYTNGALNDLQSLLWLSLSPDSRCVLETKTEASQDNPGQTMTYWVAKKARPNCNGRAYGRAISIYRNRGAVAGLQFIQNEIAVLNKAQDITNMESWQQSLAIFNTLTAP